MKTCALALLSFAFFASADPIIIGSKKFTESYVLAEIAKRAVEDAGIPAEHRQGMGGTIILWEALRTDSVSGLSVGAPAACGAGRHRSGAAAAPRF